MHKAEIVLLGKELKDAISESSLVAATFALLDEDDELGRLDQVGDEITFVQAIGISNAISIARGVKVEIAALGFAASRDLG